MKGKTWLAAGLLCVWLAGGSIRVEAVSAQAAILIEQSSGRVLWEQNADAVLPMASTTKIMTALCVLEHADLEENVVIEECMSGIEGSSMYLEVGEELTVEQLLMGLMLRSGNDAAVALALHVSGSLEAFAQLMNDKAAKLGLENTHFVNPHGLPAQGHHTTARELAVITAAAYENETFRHIVCTQEAVVPWKGHPYDRVLSSKNKILTQYAGGNGVKTGYTKAAGRCLVAGAEREDMQLIAVVLNAPDMWNDCMTMLDDGFARYDMTDVLYANEAAAQVECTFKGRSVRALTEHGVRIPLEEGENAEVTFHLPEKMDAGVAQGEQIGYAIIDVKGMDAIKVPLIAESTVREPVLHRLRRRVMQVWRKWYYALP